MFDLTRDDRQFVIAELEKTETPDLNQIAAALVQRKALAAVEKAAREHEGRQTRQPADRNVPVYHFLPPEPELLLGQSPGLLSKRLRELGAGAVPVEAPSFEEFCADYDLDPTEMRRLAAGEVSEHKGWTRLP